MYKSSNFMLALVETNFIHRHLQWRKIITGFSRPWAPPCRSKALHVLNACFMKNAPARQRLTATLKQAFQTYATIAFGRKLTESHGTIYVDRLRATVMYQNCRAVEL